MLAHLDGDFDIPNEGVNSDVEWRDDGDFKEPELILPADLFNLIEEEEEEEEMEEINLSTVQIEETDDSEEEVAKGRPSNVTVEEFNWSDDMILPAGLWLLVSFYWLREIEYFKIH